MGYRECPDNAIASRPSVVMAHICPRVSSTSTLPAHNFLVRSRATAQHWGSILQCFCSLLFGRPYLLVDSILPLQIPRPPQSSPRLLRLTRATMQRVPSSRRTGRAEVFQSKAAAGILARDCQKWPKSSRKSSNQERSRIGFRLLAAVSIALQQPRPRPSLGKEIM